MLGSEIFGNVIGTILYGFLAPVTAQPSLCFSFALALIWSRHCGRYGSAAANGAVDLTLA